MTPTSQRLFGLAALTSVLIACAPSGSAPPANEEPAADDGEALSSAQKAARVTAIRDIAAERGIERADLIAGVAYAETQLAHCWSELTWACKGPHSADCGGPVVAGAGDGPCADRQGGIGMFQFDAGTFDETLAREGSGILTLAGNIDAGIDFILGMVVDSPHVDGVSTEAQAIEWLNGATIGSAAYDDWIRTVVTLYNGCQPSWSCFDDRFAHYDDSTRSLVDELGSELFESSPRSPIEVYWSRTDGGAYQLRALPWSPEVARVEYRVDGFLLGSFPKDNPATSVVETNFPGLATFSTAARSRSFEALGLDASGGAIARGVGSIDTIVGVAVYVRQMGDAVFEVGLERAPAEVASIEVRIDDAYLLTDSVSGRTRSTRKAVRSTFQELGARDVKVTTYDAAGSVRGHLRRRVDLE